jgi:predicted  nucleic acid-binding Zn-ribbon protein
MNESISIFKELEALLNQLRTVFSDLESQLSKITDRFHSTEMEFMYGNITIDVYHEKLNQLEIEIASFKHKILSLQDLK